MEELEASVKKAPDFGPAFFFLAREELDQGHLDRAADLARRGLGADPSSDVAPLAHFVLADIYNRRGEARKADEEVSEAQRLEASLRRHPRPAL